MTTRVFKEASPRRWWKRRRARIVISSRLWRELGLELRTRGLEGRRESGAFLLTRRSGSGKTVDRIAYLDDLDPSCLVGGINFHAVGYGRLWTLCDRENVRVLADVHTHPSNWVDQSSVDRENPMVARRGHLALILPAYAMRSIAAHEVGVHEYRGDAGWASWLGRSAARLLYVES